MNKIDSTQVKITVDSQVAAAFKSSCQASSTSMSSVLSDYMAKYSKISAEKKSSSSLLSTKRQRRAAVVSIIQQLERVKDSESVYCDRIPENLRGSARYESAETWLSVLDEAIEMLEELP